MGARIGLSAALGFIFSIGTYFIFHKTGLGSALSISLLSGIGFSLMLFLFLTIHSFVMKKRYARIETQIPFPIFHKTNGNFDLGGGTIRNGNIYFCDAGIVCVCLEGKQHILDEILVQDISRIAYDTIHLHIYTKDDRLFRITLPDAATVIDLLKEKDWIG